MSEYQIIARKYRPQTFDEIIAQESIVTTLKNAIIQKRLATAYLFCGPRGTGKTTLARVFAKALNCPNVTNDCKPCNVCSVCQEIASGNSLDVLEIDGASHRGIDDIRQINETVGYSSSSGGYKIYIIDEVHMLTKEAFNALLKTLEEPPEKVKFFFATTEPHKVLPTILSRCQRFNLHRIPLSNIIEKLKSIALDLNATYEEEALRMIAARADGGLRDAESLFDQILAFHGSDVTQDAVSDVLGIMPNERLFDLDNAGKDGLYSTAFEIADEVFRSGKDIYHFIDMLIEHFRNLLQVKIAGKNAPWLTIPESVLSQYEKNSTLYSQEQCMNILDYLVESKNSIRFMPSSQVALETILLHIIRSHRQIPIESLVKRLAELEMSLNAKSNLDKPTSDRELEDKQDVPLGLSQAAQEHCHKDKPTAAMGKDDRTNCSDTPGECENDELAISKNLPGKQDEKANVPKISSNNPTQSNQPESKIHQKKEPVQNKLEDKPPNVDKGSLKQPHVYDTLMQFAAVELDGKVVKKNLNINKIASER